MSEREEDDFELAAPEAAALRQALRPFDAPAGFTERVMKRALAEQQAAVAQTDGRPVTALPGAEYRTADALPQPAEGEGVTPVSYAAAVPAQGPLPRADHRATGPKGGAKLLRWPENRLWISGLIAAALVAGIFEGEMTYKRVREQQHRIEQATQQFQTTERITVRALAQAREQLQRAGVPLNLD